MVGADGGQATFGKARQGVTPGILYREHARVCCQPVQRLAPGAGHVGNVGGAALPAFDFHRADAQLLQLRQDIHGVQADRFFNGVVHTAFHFKAAFAQRGITCVFTGV